MTWYESSTTALHRGLDGLHSAVVLRDGGVEPPPYAICARRFATGRKQYIVHLVAPLTSCVKRSIGVGLRVTLRSIAGHAYAFLLLRVSKTLISMLANRSIFIVREDNCRSSEEKDGAGSPDTVP